MKDIGEEKIRVLLIEDEKEVAELYKLKLTLDGYEVVIAEGGQEGLDRAITLQPELIFLDIKMPEMDGFEVLKKLREGQKTKDIPVVILSNFDEQDMVEKGLTLGANEYLIKSQFTPEEISKKVKDWVQED
jgi:CheY-like chemotaxis protein